MGILRQDQFANDFRLKTGGFKHVEDVLLHALQAPGMKAEPAAKAKKLTGADLIAAIQRSLIGNLKLSRNVIACPCATLRSDGLAPRYQHHF